MLNSRPDRFAPQQTPFITNAMPELLPPVSTTATASACDFYYSQGHGTQSSHSDTSRSRFDRHLQSNRRFRPYFVSRRDDSLVSEVRFYSAKAPGLLPGIGGAQGIGHVGEQPPPAFSRIDSNIRVAIVSRCEARSLFIIRQLVRSWTEHLVIYPVEESPPSECPTARDQIDNGARLLEDSG